MTQDILITPGSGEPQILFRGSGTNDTPIELNVLSSYQSATGSGTALVFEGQEGQLFAVTDNLSSGTIFSVGDITGLSMLSVDASGDVKLGEFANSVIVYPGLTLDDNVPSTTSNVLYNDGGDLMWNGVTVIQSGAAQAVDGSGTASYVARFTDTNTLGTGVIYDNGTNVGIGTASPNSKLEVNGEIAAGGTSAFTFAGNAWGYDKIIFRKDVNNKITSDANGNYKWYLQGKNLTFPDLSNDAKFGIWTDTPTQKVDIRYPASGGMALLKSTDTNDGLLFGDMAYSADNNLQGIKHASMTGSSDYMILSEGTNTYVSSKSGGVTVIRTGGNDSNSEIRLTSTEVVVNENSSSRDFRVESNNDANALFVDGVTDYVGIGTASPVGKLHIVQNNSNGRYSYFDSNLGLFIKANDNSAYNALTLENTVASANFGSSINFNLGYGGNTTTAGTAVLGARVLAAAEQTMTATTTTQDAYLALYTTQDGTSSEKLRVTSAGSVGIGTTSPARTLDLGDSGQIGFGTSVANNNNQGIYWNPADTNYAIYRSPGTWTHPNYQQLTLKWTTGIVLDPGTTYGKSHVGVKGGMSIGSTYYATKYDNDGLIVQGNVGIGTTSPQQKLHIDEGNIRIEKTTDPTIEFNNGSANRASMFYDTSEETFVLNHTDADANQLVLTSGNNVGIGTNDPNATLHVYSATSGENVFNVEGTNGSLFGVTDNLSGVLMSVNTIAGLPVLEVNSDYSLTAGRFNQNDFAISSSGNVGIGTASPSQKLHVAGNLRLTGAFYDSNNAAGTSGQVLSSTATGTDWISLSEIQGVDGTGSAGQVAFWSDSDTITGESNLYWDSSNDRLGIGTSSPQQRLDVGGNGKITFGDNVTVDGNEQGLYWSNANGYAIYRTSGTWTGPHYQQLKIKFVTGIVLDPGTIYGKSLVGVQGAMSIGTTYYDKKQNNDSLLVEGNVGIGTYSPGGKLDIQQNTTGNLLSRVYNTNNSGTGSTSLRITNAGNNVNGSRLEFSDTNYYVGTITGDRTNGIQFFTGNQTSPTQNFRMEIDPNGNVGIGTASPAAKLDVNGQVRIDSVSVVPASCKLLVGDVLHTTSGSVAQFGGSLRIKTGLLIHDNTTVGNAFYLNYVSADGLKVSRTEGTGSQNILLADTGGNVGIGTASPSQKLHIYDSTVSRLLLGTRTAFTDPYSGFNAQNISSAQIISSNYGAQLHLGSTDSTSGLTVGGITFMTTGTSSSQKRSAIISSTLSSNSSSSVTGGIEFWTANGGTLAEQMRITSLGNVGIGTTTAFNKVNIKSTADNAYALRVQGSTNNVANVWTGIGIAGEDANTKAAIIFQDIGSSYSRGDLHFAINNEVNQNGATPSDARLTIKSGGNVGVSTTSPQQKLHVVGDQRIENATDPKLEFHDGAAVGGYVKFDTSEDNLVLSHVDVAGDNQIALANDGNVGIGTASPNAVLHAYGSTPSGTVFNVEGTNGSLFSVVDNLSGVLMSVNNNAGLPVFEVYDDDSIIAGRFAQDDFVITSSGDIGMGTANPASKLEVNGTVTATCASLGQLNVDNLRLDGNTLSSTNTNGALILNPNGTGALQADGGGNARGAYAVDLQRNRNLDTEVASGACSVIGGGQRNTASGYWSTVGGGYCNRACGNCSTIGGGCDNDACGACSTVGGGSSNLASGNRSTVSGGHNNWATNIYSFVGGGCSNLACGWYTTIGGGRSSNAQGKYSTIGGGAYSSSTASADYSTIPGGYYAKATRYGEVAHAAGAFSFVAGTAQHSTFVARKNTTSTSTTYLALDGGSSRLTLPARDTAFTFDIKVIAINTIEQESGSWNFRGGIYRDDDNNVGFIGSLIEEINVPSPGKIGTIALQADGTNYALNINVTPGTSDTIRWVAVIDVVQVSWNTP